MNRPVARWVILFVCVQVIGLACMWVWPHVQSIAGSFVWGTTLIALFPGNMLSAIIIEKVFWSSGLSLTSMAFIEMPVLVAINFALWFGVIGAIRRLTAHRSR
jgi:hypothetical protein